ncbi:MAG: fasciclin domain-containing protein [Nostoc sp. ChiSLP02]|nr:fasciclin domain-containing protein [Nostoc sp. DedSLP05]MDZ8100042.1 fasciclin domain-containing protein [Nostoc sp. DedSLP01]MDZ8186599.1 fasciclin domain-containing protein [Nostoc sp. ChiSLP02]
MKATKGIIRKTFFKIISISSLVSLSACAEPVTQTPTATVPSISQTPLTTVPPIVGVPTIIPSPVTQTPPPTQNLAELAKTAAAQGQFQTLIKVVGIAGVNEQLTAPGPYTIFAPTDAAFSALPQVTLDKLLQPANKQQLVRLLAYHVIPGQINSQELTSGELKTVEGTPVKITVDRNTKTISVNNAKVTQPDIPATNGIVHVVDRVLLPPNFPTSLNATPKQR